MRTLSTVIYSRNLVQINIFDQRMSGIYLLIPGAVEPKCIELFVEFFSVPDIGTPAGVLLRDPCSEGPADAFRCGVFQGLGSEGLVVPLRRGPDVG